MSSGAAPEDLNLQRSGSQRRENFLSILRYSAFNQSIGSDQTAAASADDRTLASATTVLCSNSLTVGCNMSGGGLSTLSSVGTCVKYGQNRSYILIEMTEDYSSQFGN